MGALGGSRKSSYIVISRKSAVSKSLSMLQIGDSSRFESQSRVGLLKKGLSSGCCGSQNSVLRKV